MLTEEQRENCYDAAMRITSMCSWQDTPQGDDYWQNMYEALMELSRGEERMLFTDPIPIPFPDRARQEHE